MHNRFAKVQETIHVGSARPVCAFPETEPVCSVLRAALCFGVPLEGTSGRQRTHPCVFCSGGPSDDAWKVMQTVGATKKCLEACFFNSKDTENWQKLIYARTLLLSLFSPT